MTSTLHRIVAANNLQAVSRSDLDLFKAETYFLVQIGEPFLGVEKVRVFPGYLSSVEIQEGARLFSEALASRKSWNHRWEEALRTRSGDLWQGLRSTHGVEELQEILNTQISIVDSAERAMSLEDIIRMGEGGMYHPTWGEGKPLLLDKKRTWATQRRVTIVRVLEERGSFLDLKGFVATGARIHEKPDLGKGATDTENAIKWAFSQYKKISTKTHSEVQDAMRRVNEETALKFPNANLIEAHNLVSILIAQWTQNRA